MAARQQFEYSADLEKAIGSIPTPLRQGLSTTAVLIALTTLPLLFTLALRRIYQVLTRPPPTSLSKSSQNSRRGHLLILLGSGGHTAEMLSILHTLGLSYLNTRFDRRTWVISSGDSFSAERAREFETQLDLQTEHGEVSWDIITVRRARRVHQSLLSTPLSALGCLWDCLNVLRGVRSSPSTQRKLLDQSEKEQEEKKRNRGPDHPDLILTNGPGTGVILVLASLILLFLRLVPVTSDPGGDTRSDSDGAKKADQSSEKGNVRGGCMRAVYIESWARVKTMSLSGKMLRFLGARILVQWRGLADGEDLTVQSGKIDEMVKGKGRKSRSSWPKKMEYVGAIVT